MAGQHEISRVGVVGLGKMRLPMAQHLVAQDFDVTGAEGAAKKGTLLELGGGDKAVFDRCRPWTRSHAQNRALKTGADERLLPWAEKDMMMVQQEADKARICLPLARTVKEVIKGLKIERGQPIPTPDD